MNATAAEATYYRLHYGRNQADTSFAFADLKSATHAAQILSADFGGAWHVRRSTDWRQWPVATYTDGKNLRFP